MEFPFAFPILSSVRRKRTPLSVTEVRAKRAQLIDWDYARSRSLLASVALKTGSPSRGSGVRVSPSPPLISWLQTHKSLTAVTQLEPCYRGCGTRPQRLVRDVPAVVANRRAARGRLQPRHRGLHGTCLPQHCGALARSRVFGAVASFLTRRRPLACAIDLN